MERISGRAESTSAPTARTGQPCNPSLGRGSLSGEYFCLVTILQGFPDPVLVHPVRIGNIQGCWDEVWKIRNVFLDRGVQEQIAVVFQDSDFSLRELIQIRADLTDDFLRHCFGISGVATVSFRRTATTPIRTLQLMSEKIRH